MHHFLIAVLIAVVKSALGAHSPHAWFVPAKEFAAGKYNPQEMAAVEIDDQPVYVGRMPSGDGHYVGMYNPRFKGFYYADEDGNQKAIPMNHESVQVLVYPTGAMTWAYRNAERTIKDDTPPNMTVLGFDPKTGEPIYGCRIHAWGHVHFGTLRMNDDNGCQITRDGKSYWNKEFEVMVLSFLGISGQGVD